MAENETMLALKLKIEPTKEQAAFLDEAFWKWASICTRIGNAEDLAEARKSLAPRKTGRLEFSLTQLHQANTDVKDARDALERRGQQIERTIAKDESWIGQIEAALKDPDK